VILGMIPSLEGGVSYPSAARRSNRPVLDA
jgi:hypothetical protein